jgi:hypothetical protein
MYQIHFFHRRNPVSFLLKSRPFPLDSYSSVFHDEAILHHCVELALALSIANVVLSLHISTQTL